MTRTVLFYGCGWAATHIWMPNLRQTADFEFLCIDENARAATPDDAAPCRMLERLEDRPAHAPDLGIVSSPNRMHADHAQMLLKLRIPVIVEKPVCLSRQEFNALRDAAQHPGARLLRSNASLYDPHFQTLADFVREFDPAEISTVRAEWTRAAGVPSSKWLTSARHAATGSSLDLGWHLLECVSMLIGYQVIDLKSASFRFPDGSDTKFARWYAAEGSGSSPLVDVDLASSLSFETAQGTSVDIRTSWDEIAPFDAVRFAVAGDQFALKLETIFGLSRNGPSQMRITGHRRGAQVDIRLAPKPPGLAHEVMIRKFVAAEFDPERLGQNLDQLEVLATTAEQIIARHDICRTRAQIDGAHHGSS